MLCNSGDDTEISEARGTDKNESLLSEFLVRRRLTGTWDLDFFCKVGQGKTMMTSMATIHLIQVFSSASLRDTHD